LTPKKTNHPADKQQGDLIIIDHFSENASFFIPFLADGQIRLTNCMFNRRLSGLSKKFFHIFFNAKNAKVSQSAQRKYRNVKKVFYM